MVIPSYVRIVEALAVRFKPFFQFAIFDLIDRLDVSASRFVLRVFGPSGEEVGTNGPVSTVSEASFGTPFHIICDIEEKQKL